MRVSGVNIPDNKKIEISLRYLYGIGQSLSSRILSVVQIDKNKLTKDLTAADVNKIQSVIEKNYKVEGELRQIVKQNINRMKDIKCYKGVRHLKRLPVRWQRTKTNSRTVRGNVRHTMASGKRKESKT